MRCMHFMLGLCGSLVLHSAFANCTDAQSMPNNGRGKFIVPSAMGGGCYEGEVSNGKFSGFGKHILANGDIAVGQFKNSMLNGAGEVFGTRTLQRGQFLDGKLHGFGISRLDKLDPNTKKIYEVEYYEGAWVNGVRHGLGYLNIGGVTYEGDFEKGLTIGYGELFSPLVGRYVGTVRSIKFNGSPMSEKHGQGIFYDLNGNSYEGIWRGHSIKTGTAKYANGDIYKGEFTNALINGRPTIVPHGRGEMKKADGSELIAIFKEGKLSSLLRLTAPVPQSKPAVPGK